MTTFSELKLVDGEPVVTKTRTIKSSSLVKCPHSIWMPQHYDENESCRCDDVKHTEMLDWGYEWDGDRWR